MSDEVDGWLAVVIDDGMIEKLTDVSGCDAFDNRSWWFMMVNEVHESITMVVF